MHSLVLVFLVITSVVVSGWKNNWDKPLNFECPSSKYSIHRIASVHSNHYEDRLFDFSCRRVSSASGRVSCSWSGYVNDYDELVLYTCPNQGYLNGVHSIHYDRTEDRKYSFRCCIPKSVKGLCLRNCHWTSFVNHWDGYFNYYVPYGHVIRGVGSIHNNKKE